MADPNAPRHRGDFDIAVICALQTEADAVEAMFDRFWEMDNSYGKAPGDPNAYTTGRIGKHNVVLAYMPGMGKGASASVAASFRSSFSGIRLGLVVGVCGGVPHMVDKGKDMLLGDIVISTGVVQFDLARQYSNGVLGRPNQEIRAFLRKIQGLRGRKQLKHDSLKHLTTLCSEYEFQTSSYPGVDEDILYPPAYRHKHQQRKSCRVCAKCRRGEDEVCEEALELSCFELKCDKEKQVLRVRLEEIKVGVASGTTTVQHKPEIHFGRIASGDVVMKSGYHRDEIAAKEDVIAFEMEGAGVWDNFPTVVIKGVCDYADSHKSKKWQRYAAASAASCMKAFLKEWRGVDRPSYLEVAFKDATPVGNVLWTVPRALNTLFTGRVEVLEEMQEALSSPTSTVQQKRFVITGLGGQGKSDLCIKVAEMVRQKYWGVFWIDVNEVSAAEKAFIAVADTLGTAADNLADARQALANTQKTWLLILDNADDPDFDYQVYFPSGTHSAIVMTSRVAECASYGTVGSEALERLDGKHSVQLLLKAAELPEESR